MKLPIRFPDPLEETAERTREFQRLPPDERLRQLLDVIETGFVLLHESPRREAIDVLFLQREREWQGIQRELFRRHGA